MTTKSFSPVQSHGKFKQTKVKTKIINGSPAPVYKGLEAIECLLSVSDPMMKQMISVCKEANTGILYRYVGDISGNVCIIKFNPSEL